MLVNAFSRSGLNVKGLGPSQIEDLQQVKLLERYPAEAYTLKKRTQGKLPEAPRSRNFSLPLESRFLETTCQRSSLRTGTGIRNSSWHIMRIHRMRSW